MTVLLGRFLAGLALTLTGAFLPLYLWATTGTPVSPMDWAACVFAHLIAGVISALGGIWIYRSAVR